MCIPSKAQIGAAMLLAAGPMAGVASAQSVVPMPVIGAASPPIGFVQFCQDYPASCVGVARATPTVTLTKARMDLLTSVNREVNGAIEPVTDADNYGVTEKWAFPVNGRGDCEDYVLEKRRRLVAAGWPVGALLITVVRDEKGDGHAVLTVRTDRGDLVLDNQNGEILPWYRTPYRFVKRQSGVDVSRWEMIDDRRVDHVATTSSQP